MKLYILILILVSYGSINAQFLNGAKQNSTANSNISAQSDAFSVFINPAKLSDIHRYEFGIFYSPGAFGLSELKSGSAAFAFPVKDFSGAIGISSFGFDLYNESKITAGVSKILAENISLGFTLSLNNIKISNYGSDNSLSLNFGAISKLNENFSLGFYYENLNRATFGNYKNQIPSFIVLGISFKRSDFVISGSIEKETDKEFSPRLGFDYRIIKAISLRSGISDNPENFSAGLGIFVDKFNLNYALVRNAYLGFSHMTDLRIIFE